MTSYLSSFSALRFAGLASGIDTESIVKELMSAQRIPLDKLNQQKQILEWQREDYRSINDSLRSFRDRVFNMKLQGTYLVKTASSSNEAALTATAGSTAAPGMYSVTVTQLAAGVSKGSQGALPDEADGSGGTRTLAGQFELSGTISFTLEGSNGSKDFTFDSATATINTVVAEINAANLGISASYDASLNRFFLTTTQTGEAAKIKVTNDPNSFLTGPLENGTDNTLKLKMKLYNAPETGLYTGQDAFFSFGDAAGLKSPTNTATVNGVTLTFKQGGGASATVTVAAATDTVFNSIKEFVEAYNELIGKINAELAETRYPDYPPLTDEQREKLSDEQEKKWEELARSGLLRNDPLLRSILFKMRSTLAATVPGQTTYKNLAAVGITTGSYEENGKLYIDETKLKEALRSNPEEVMNLFTRTAGAYTEKGIAQRLYDDVNAAISQISAKAGAASIFSTYDNSAIGKQIAEINDRIARLEEHLATVEDRYWRQFTAMEQAIQQMNATSAWLAQQFSMYRGS
ncbi:MAG: flagellar hook-associated protein 2 [Firmicutes bacterium]|nr:flagellar hook-associated protein 2 [Bacillota bacterium]